jgi:hypothetical protein
LAVDIVEVFSVIKNQKEPLGVEDSTVEAQVGDEETPHCV